MNFDSGNDFYNCHLDFSKTFDRVPHSLLMKTLAPFGIGSIF